MTPCTVFLGLASNVERALHLSLALTMLEEHLHQPVCSPVFESACIEDRGPPFHNLVVTGQTRLPLAEFILWLKEIEQLHGRGATPDRAKVSLDIDILLFGDLAGRFAGIELPRPALLERAYMLYPLYLLAPDRIHPSTGTSMAELWHARQVGPALKAVPLHRSS